MPDRRDASDGSLNLLQGTLDLLILQALAWGQMHGYGISRIIRERTSEALLVEDAALYQALHRLERRGSIEAEWGVSENNRRAKYYALTPSGRRVLRRQSEQWRRYAAAVSAVLDPI
ncbi:MAG TPA: PadR family transcriptional regulator [Gemmatimonadaceae bacterium]